MKTLVVYYSRTGNNKKIARQVAKRFHADTEELVDKKSRKGMIGWMGAGRDAMRESITEIQKPIRDPYKYELVVFVTPTWAGKITPAMRTYINGLNIEKLKQVAFISCCGSKATNTLKMLEGLIKEPIAVLEIRQKEVVQNTYQTKLKDFFDKVK